jgi:hypothetical protein
MIKVPISAAAFVLFARASFGEIVISGDISGTATYTQNFNSLPTGLPSPWTNDSTLPGWFADYYSAGVPGVVPPYTGPLTGIDGNDGSLVGDSFCAFYNNSSDLGMGFETDSHYFSTGVLFRNALSQPITFNTISFTGEQWRTGNNYGNSVLSFSYKLSDSPITSSDPLGTNGWTNVSDLNFTGPNSTQYYAGENGDAPQNQAFKSADLGLTVQPGQYVMFRWSMSPSGSVYAGSALAIDDLSVTYTVPEPSTVALGLCALPLLLRRARNARTLAL